MIKPLFMWFDSLPIIFGAPLIVIVGLIVGLGAFVAFVAPLLGVFATFDTHRDEMGSIGPYTMVMALLTTLNVYALWEVCINANDERNVQNWVLGAIGCWLGLWACGVFIKYITNYVDAPKESWRQRAEKERVFNNIRS